MKTPMQDDPNSARARATATAAGPIAAAAVSAVKAVSLAFLLCMVGTAHAAGHDDAVAWSRSDTEAFTRARAEQRFVLLYLEAVWCHWCHVMDEKTYGDAAIRRESAADCVQLR